MTYNHNQNEKRNTQKHIQQNCKTPEKKNKSISDYLYDVTHQSHINHSTILRKNVQIRVSNL